MPQREQTFYRAWRALAQNDLTLRLLGIRNAADTLRGLPERSEDALLDLVHDMRIPRAAREPYFSQHQAALLSWVGYLKRRSHQKGHPRQEAYSIDLVEYLAIRLFYERELVESACHAHLGLAGTDRRTAAVRVRFPGRLSSAA
ncbi:putative inorganic carbon transporter subunit DabA [Candidatus Nitrospira inopinata]|jgi:uncharacterized protein YbcC (UPF0753/DUF2309 family)|uniref:Uncharacterized protein n=1 Tax=Candidatus Nitrospira inopinata TaxID=1715989 RepID=A0A0S4KT21_9BACT|nr:putative inorganic carbon transporter subunit DabA [Candidatus Nitrospira inopinata]CUQ66457.1 protein of unknown function [Candidatus Nitrospira inopinata]